MESKRSMQVRRVVTGVNKKGRSTIVEDDVCKTIVVTPMFNTVDIWRINSLPTGFELGDASTGQVVLDPPIGGLVVRVATFPPDSTWKGSDYEKALTAIGAGAAHVEDANSVGMHETQTLDIAYIVSGEMVAIVEETETVLKAGDTLVQRGTKHAWSNRTNAPAIVHYTQVSAKRS